MNVVKVSSTLIICALVGFIGWEVFFTRQKEATMAEEQWREDTTIPANALRNAGNRYLREVGEVACQNPVWHAHKVNIIIALANDVNQEELGYQITQLTEVLDAFKRMPGYLCEKEPLIRSSFRQAQLSAEMKASRAVRNMMLLAENTEASPMDRWAFEFLLYLSALTGVGLFLAWWWWTPNPMDNIG